MKTGVQIREEITKLNEYLATRTLTRIGAGVTVARRDALLWVLDEKDPWGD